MPLVGLLGAKGPCSLRVSLSAVGGGRDPVAELAVGDAVGLSAVGLDDLAGRLVGLLAGEQHSAHTEVRAETSAPASIRPACPRRRWVGTTW